MLSLTTVGVIPVSTPVIASVEEFKTDAAIRALGCLVIVYGVVPPDSDTETVEAFTTVTLVLLDLNPVCGATVPISLQLKTITIRAIMMPHNVYLGRTDILFSPPIDKSG